MKEIEETDATSIEEELRDLWQELAQKGYGKEQAVMRACVLNLIVFCGHGWNRQEQDQTLAEITSEHPSRVILITPTADDNDWLEVSVQASCHSMAGGRNHVCCEVIHFCAAQSSLDRVLSLIRPLLVPDLPTAVWWRSRPDPEASFLLSLIEMADRVILDTGSLDPESSEFRRLSNLIESNRERTAFSDMAWSRLTPWRRALAGFSDVPSWKGDMEKISGVEIEYRRSREMPQLSIRALYLLSWLGSRFGWIVEKPLDEGGTTPRMVVLRKSVDDGRIEASFHATLSDPPDVGITRVRLLTRDHPSGDFEVWRKEEQRHLQSRVLIDQQESVSRVSLKVQQKPSQLVCRELEILGHDFVFEQAFRFAQDCLP